MPLVGRDPKSGARGPQCPEALFLELLDRATAKGENLSAAGTANNYASTRFARVGEAKAKDFSRNHFADAFDRLFEAGKIVVETYGPPSNGTYAHCSELV